MAFIKLLFLFIFILFLQHRGIIYRTGKPVANPVVRAKPFGSEGNLAGSWRLLGVSDKDPIVIMPNGKAYEHQVELKDKKLIVSFFPDSTFTQITATGQYRTGVWDYDSASGSALLTMGRNTEEITVDFSKARNVRLINMEIAPGESAVLYESGETIGAHREDPFHAVNNRWRIKPEKAENRQQLVRRLKNYLLHCAFILKAASERESRQVSFEFSTGIVRIYNVGIGISKRENVPAEWIGAFHSREDAMKAYDIYEDYLITKRHPKHDTGKWVHDDYAILIDIHNGIK